MRKFVFLLVFVARAFLPVYAQHEHHTPEKKPAAEKPKQQQQQAQPQHQHPPAQPSAQPPAQPQHQHPPAQQPGAHAGHTMQMDGVEMNTAGMLMMMQGSGTSVNPSSSPMSMVGKRVGSWNLMAHAQGHISAIQQNGPRGGDKVFSTNWFMGMAERRAGSSGSFMLRTMLSLEPLTVSKRRYPLMFQTGETAFGKPIVDGQHPHDFVMELAAQYTHQVAENTLLNFYFGVIGDPALGPVAFPHRVSAMELPQATLAHHLQDSTHIAADVVTVGFQHKWLRLEASGFHGREPNEHRWNIDQGAIDSWAGRLTLLPTQNFTAQVSAGRLAEPEELEEGDIVRATASLTYNKPLQGGHWATSLLWGRNHKVAEQKNLNSYGLESLYQFRDRNYLTGRVELVDKDELFAGRGHDEAHGHGIFRVAGYTLGYTRDFNFLPHLTTGIGGNFTLYGIPRELKEYYGDRPAGFMVYLRFRLKG